VLYALALGLEFGALIALRRKEPHLRGSFRIPLPRAVVIALAMQPLIKLGKVIYLSCRDGEYWLPTIIGAAIAIGTGPLAYVIARRRVVSASSA
jgi:hypothetical protein